MDGNEGGVYPCYMSKTRGPRREGLLPVYLPPWLRNLAPATGQRKGQAICQAKVIGHLGSPNWLCTSNMQILLFFPQWLLSPHYHTGFKGPEASPVCGLLHPCPWPRTSFQLSAVSPCHSNAVGVPVSSSTTATPCPLGSSCSLILAIHRQGEAKHECQHHALPQLSRAKGM